MKVIPFKSEHVDLAQMSGLDIDVFIEHKHILEKTSLVGTFIDDGRIILFAGFHMNDNREWEGWLVPTIYFKKGSFCVIKCIVRYLKLFQEVLHVKQFKARGHDDPLIHKFLVWLGFEYRGKGNNDEMIYIKET